MTAVVGWTGTLLGLVASVTLLVQSGRAQWRPAGPVRRDQLRLAVGGMVLGALVAFAALEFAILTDDFSVSYVAETSARETPLLFKISTAWSALDGSIVLWALVLTGFTVVVLRQVRSVEDRLGTGALAVMGAVSAFFFAMILTVANPFGILENPPGNGPGPNPILQNHYMVLVHPPMLYLGFVGFTVPFAYAIAALLIGDGGAEWLRRTRRSNLVAWTFLSGGLLYGAWWSYEVLGWGGFWAWDPVENAALVPWLLATALVHSSVVQVRRGMLQSWNFVLVLLTFSMTIFGTFLTRSSVISSVHSFSQSGVGPVLLGFFLVVLGGGFGLFALRGVGLASARRPESLASREGAFVANNILLTLFAFVVLLGTTYPMLVEAFTGAQLSVGRPFFDRLAVPISFALLAAMGVGPFTPYRKASGAVMWDRLRLPLLVASAVSAGAVAAGLRSWPVVAMLLLVSFMVAGSVQELVRTTPSFRAGSLWRVLRSRRGYWGGQLAHLGVGVVALAIVTSGTLAARASATLDEGQSVAFGDLTVTFEGTHEHNSPGRAARAAALVLRRDGEVVRTAEPRLTRFNGSPQAVGTPDVWATATQDVYVSLSSIKPSRVGINLYRFPFMWLLWLGGSLVMLGGLWALGLRAPRRRPAPAGRDREPEPQPAAVHV